MYQTKLAANLPAHGQRPTQLVPKVASFNRSPICGVLCSSWTEPTKVRIHGQQPQICLNPHLSKPPFAALQLEGPIDPLRGSRQSGCRLKLPLGRTRGCVKMEPFVFFAFVPPFYSNFWPILRSILKRGQLWSCDVFPCFIGISGGFGCWNTEFTNSPFVLFGQGEPPPPPRTPPICIPRH